MPWRTSTTYCWVAISAALRAPTPIARARDRRRCSADKTWHAYLSTDTENAKDRIGAGPWYNAKGAKIADDVASLHGDANNSPSRQRSTKPAPWSTAAATRPTVTTS